jgi:hypothetical protein
MQHMTTIRTEIDRPTQTDGLWDIWSFGNMLNAPEADKLMSFLAWRSRGVTIQVGHVDIDEVFKRLIASRDGTTKVEFPVAYAYDDGHTIYGGLIIELGPGEHRTPTVRHIGIHT